MIMWSVITTAMQPRILHDLSPRASSGLVSPIVLVWGRIMEATKFLYLDGNVSIYSTYNAWKDEMYQDSTDCKLDAGKIEP